MKNRTLAQLEAHLLRSYPLMDIEMYIVGDYLDLASIAFPPAYQNLGYGSAVLKEIKTWCKENRVPKIQLFSVATAFKFYEKNGFVRIHGRSSPKMVYTIKEKD